MSTYFGNIWVKIRDLSGKEDHCTEWLNRKQPGIIKKDKQTETNEVEEAIKVKPRLCWVWNADRGMPYAVVVGRIQKVHNWKRYIDVEGRDWEHAELISREEIEQYLGE